jgi:hypothetical protein
MVETCICIEVVTYVAHTGHIQDIDGIYWEVNEQWRKLHRNAE